MTISDKIFELIKERGMTQKEFSEATGISQSSISDWKRKRTNPESEKILVICEVLHVTPYELLSGKEGEGHRSNSSETIVLDKDSEEGQLITEYMRMDAGRKQRMLGYLHALTEMMNTEKPG